MKAGPPSLAFTTQLTSQQGPSQRMLHEIAEGGWNIWMEAWSHSHCTLHVQKFCSRFCHQWPYHCPHNSHHGNVNDRHASDVLSARDDYHHHQDLRFKRLQGLCSSSTPSLPAIHHCIRITLPPLYHGPV